mgnify:CR=1 FL=1
MVPKGWEVKTLEELATVVRGKFSARPRNDPKYFGGDIPFVQTGDIAAAKTFLKEYSQTLNEDGLKVSRLFSKDIILITIAANIGDTAITLFDVACPDSLVAIQPNEYTDCFWLNSYLMICKEELNNQATQNAQKNINLQVLKPLNILTPPFPEQRKIAKVLVTWDKAIITTEKLIENSKQQKKALIQQLLTRKKRFSGFFCEWKRHSLSDLAYIDKESLGKETPSDFTFKYISLSDANSGVISDKLKIYSYKSAPSRARRMVQEDDILLANVRPNLQGFAKITSKHSECIASTGFSVITPKQNTSSDYIYHYLFSSHITGQINCLVVGSNYPAINSSDVAGLKIYSPNFQEQQKIASALASADKEIEILKKKHMLLKQEKKALMQQLLTGKRRVKIEQNLEEAS